MKKRTKISLGVLVTVIVIVGIMVTPTIWRYSLFRKARLTIESGDEVKAIRLITQLHKSPFFDLDWTIQKSAFKVPHGDRFDRIFGCPSCKGNYYTLLYYAVSNGLLSLAQEMILLGASIESHDDRGHWMLAGAIRSGKIEMLNLIINSGANVSINDRLEFSTLHLAALRNNNENILKVLLEHGADINATDFRGWTPLDWACVWNTNSITHLLKYDAKFGTNRTMELPLSKDVAHLIKNMHNQQVAPTVKTPVESGNEQDTAGHP